ncbi:kinase-like domain-containing protein [Russula compacta]|nr:kinase-like domain-containing protein [Russula compacta]
MRLYKQKDIPKQHRTSLDSPPGPPSAPPGSLTQHRLKRAAEAVSRQISGHNAMVSQFKEMKLPRPPMFSTKPATAPETVSSCPPQATKGSGKPRTVPERPPISRAPTSAVSAKHRATLASANANSPSPTKPPGLGLEKATPPVKKASTPRAVQNRPQSVSSPIRSPRQRASAKPSISPTNPTSDLANISITSPSKQIDVDEPLLSASCFHSLEEDPELDEDLLPTVDLTSGFEFQVAQIFAMGLGSVSENQVVHHGLVTPPIIAPEATPASTLEPMSAVVEWWEPAVNTTVESDVALELKFEGKVDGFETIPLDACQPTSVVTFDAGLPRAVPCQPPSIADYEHVATLGQGGFGAVSLAVHKPSQRQCVIKAISNAIVEEENVVRVVLEEQRIMREVSGYPFLSGLLASFVDRHGFYLVSEYCRSTLFDEYLHMPETYKKLASAELACAVHYLHSLGIIHRDIRLENVMLKNDGHVVLGEFGLALHLESPSLLAPRLGGSIKTRGVCGTLPYMAPEVLRNLEYSYGVDWFAYGVFLYVFYLDKFPWLGEYEHPVSYLKEMMSTISLGVIFQNGSFGDLLSKLFCVDQAARADFSVVRRATFFADIDWQSVIPVNSSSSYLSPSGRSMGNSEPYSNFTWLTPSMIVEEATTPQVGGADWSFKSTIAESDTPSHCDSPSSERSPLPCGSLQFFDSFSLSHLFRNSSSNFDLEGPIFTLPPEPIATFDDSGIGLGQGTTPPTPEDDEALVRMSIKSLDIGEEPVFELPSGWKEVSVFPPGLTAPSLLQPEPTSTRRTSVLPKLKSLWKRATSKFVSRQA